jgi:hypothetical protein
MLLNISKNLKGILKEDFSHIFMWLAYFVKFDQTVYKRSARWNYDFPASLHGK